MKATVIVDNIGNEECKGEWGLSIFIEYDDKKILLDVGASGLFLENAKNMGIDISSIDYAVLSHGHYDHSDGMRTFFEENKKASFYFQKDCQENCYFKKWFIKKYIGIPRGITEEYKDRIEYVSGDYKIAEGIYLIPHKTEGLSKIGKRENMYTYEAGVWRPDDFAHEQSLVFDTEDGLVIFNSCSHGGADNIINEVSATFPDKKVLALIGGFHLFKKNDEFVRDFAKRVKETGIKYVYTGHSTGKRAYSILKEEIGEGVEQLRVGLEIEF